MLIQERLQLILKMHNITPSSFADKLGVQRSNVSHVLSGRNKPSLDFLEKIILQFPRVNAHWLITGEMPSSQQSEQQREVDTKVKASTQTNSEEEVTIPTERVPVKIVEFYSDNTFVEYFPKKL